MDLNEFERIYFGFGDEEKLALIKFVLLHTPQGIKLRNLFSDEEVSKIGGFDLDLIGGQTGEFAFLNIATSGKHEVKRDYEVSQTGRIAVELECNGKPSCLSITDSPFWVYWLSGSEYQDEVAIIITVPRLRLLTRTGHLVYGGDGDLSLLSLLDVRDLLRPNSWIEKKLRDANQIKLF